MSRRSQTGRIQRHTASYLEPRSLATVLPRPLRLVTFAALALLVAGLAITLVVSRLVGPASTDATAVAVHASMGGFDPAALTVKAGATVKIELSSMDSSAHTDGGGWHQFAIDDLGINQKVGPLTSEVFQFTAPATAGTYRWYCDICCGGKENPSMRGTLTVAA
ncbi:MAG: cupredoxin domain-containing protein [Chloroflexi bacterium]|nr:cupredoxin domain-containing protein [Chloroflexota bacterium]